MRSSGLSKIHSWINITIGLILFWLVGGVYLFLKPEHNQFWGLGELGDYFGGGLGGLAILMIIYTAKLQANQLELQSSELRESGVMRSYELFKPELEGLSVRIVSKLSNSDKVKISNDDFNLLYEKYQVKGDKTVFLREIQKIIIQSMNGKISGLDSEADEAINRYKDICYKLEQYLQDEETGDDFSKAMRSTEIFQCYNALKRVE
jgi:hypothetical protein